MTYPLCIATIAHPAQAPASRKASRAAQTTAPKPPKRQTTEYERLIRQTARQKWETAYLASLDNAGVPRPDRREFLFALGIGRRWRADFCYDAARLLIEVEGAVYAAGRHTRGAGYTEDCRKYNYAALLNLRVLRFTGEMIESGEAAAMTRHALELWGGY